MVRLASEHCAHRHVCISARQCLQAEVSSLNLQTFLTGAIALLATGGAAAAATVASAAAPAPIASAAQLALSAPAAAPLSAAQTTAPATGAPQPAAQEPAVAESPTGDAGAEASAPYYAAHLAAVGQEHLASASPPPAMTVNLQV